MPYDNIISRTDADSLIPVEVSRQIIQGMTEESAALRLLRNVTMSSKTQKQPVLSALPLAYWVTGDTGLKQTTELNWDNKILTAEEMAVIVPIPEAVLDDSEYDLWAEAKPRIVEAMARRLDGSVFLGISKPASWPDSIADGAIAAGNVVERGTSTTAEGGIAQDINLTMMEVEDDGYDVNGFVTSRRFRGALRGARDANGQRLLDIQGDVERVESQPVAYAMSGLWTDPATAEAVQLIAGDFNAAIIGVRQDITFKLFTEGVVQNADGTIAYNLMQQDMVAMRVVARYAYQIANPINYSQETEADRFPFAVLSTAAV
jgi:HK97 family phage major capsid protein